MITSTTTAAGTLYTQDHPSDDFFATAEATANTLTGTLQGVAAQAESDLQDETADQPFLIWLGTHPIEQTEATTLRFRAPNGLRFEVTVREL